ncbi:MAG: hypothetical protein ACI92G_000109 [Candidatus Pelagisphaera sp.]|jgi:hypothetical protein
MKNLFVFALIALILGSATASTAKADREGRALIGGIIGGLIIGSIIDDDDHRHHRSRSHVSVNHSSSHYGSHCGCSGHHDTISVKTWVNGNWSVHYDSYGHRHRDWHPGHYIYRNERVWVAHNRGCSFYSSPSRGNYGHHDDYRGNSRHRR